MNRDQLRQVEQILRTAEMQIRPSASYSSHLPAHLRHLPMNVQKAYGFRPCEDFDVGQEILRVARQRRFTEDADLPHNAALLVFATANQIVRDNSSVTAADRDVNAWGRRPGIDAIQVRSAFHHALVRLSVENEKLARQGVSSG